MGLFSTQPGYQREDLTIAFESARLLVDWWNFEYCDLYGFKLWLSLESLEACCIQGATLFDEAPHYFASPPGPFKRVAAFLVLGCVHPFLGFEQNGRPPSRRNALPNNDYEERVWRVRFLLQILPRLFARLRVRVNGQWVKVDWKGFPTPHFELEFMNWLKWLDPLKELEETVSKVTDWPQFQKKRLARMVMATALSLEASCYASQAGGCQHPLMGQTNGCFAKLSDEQVEDLYFDLLPGN